MKCILHEVHSSISLAEVPHLPKLSVVNSATRTASNDSLIRSLEAHSGSGIRTGLLTITPAISHSR